MTQLDQIKNKINKALYHLRFFDAADLDDVNVITTSSTGSFENSHRIELASGTFDGKKIEGVDSKGNNVHLLAEYIIDIN